MFKCSATLQNRMIRLYCYNTAAARTLRYDWRKILEQKMKTKEKKTREIRRAEEQQN